MGRGRGGRRIGAGRKPINHKFVCICGSKKHHADNKCNRCYKKQKRSIEYMMKLLATIYDETNKINLPY